MEEKKVGQEQEKGSGLVCPDCGYIAKDATGLFIHRGFKHLGWKRSPAKKKAQPTPQPTLENFTGERKNGENGVAPVGVVPTGVEYDDWNGVLEILKKAYEAQQFVLIVGPKGTGKTTAVRKFAELMGKPLYSINFSLRTKESHLVGTTVLQNGTTKFALGVIPLSMEEGGILYLDELNAAEADVLLRLDEALDDRREIILKEAGEVRTVKAKPGWFVIATINPLSHTGTKELPPQLLSRFPVRIVLDYPPEEVEKRIVRAKTGVNSKALDLAIKLANKLREAAKVEDIYYSPSLRETIAYAKLVSGGMDPRTSAELVFANAYYIWGPGEVQKVKDLIASLWGEQK